MTDTTDADLRALEATLLSMPPARALALRVAGCEDGRLRLEAPLAANVNDKGSAFGGSLTSLMTLAGWGLATLQLSRAGLAAEVYVADAESKYLAPLHADLRVEAWLEEDASWDAFLATLRGRGRARVTVLAQVALPGGGVATRMRARYVAILDPVGRDRDC